MPNDDWQIMRGLTAFWTCSKYHAMLSSLLRRSPSALRNLVAAPIPAGAAITIGILEVVGERVTEMVLLPLARLLTTRR
jgi:hypothetical protein